MSRRPSKLRILIIMRDTPDTQANKGGLFPTAIRHHADLGFEVYVASMAPMGRYHEDLVRSLGAQPYIPPPSFSGRLGADRLLSMLNRKRAPGADLMTQRVIAHIGVTVAPDVVVGLQSYPTGLIAKQIASALGVKYVTWEHVSSYHTGRGLSVPDAQVAALFQESHAVLTVSSSLRASIRQRFDISLENACQMPNPIPAGFVDRPESPPPEWLANVPSGAFLFASWTSWREIKRIDLLLAAFAKTARARSAASLVVVGSMRGDAPAVTEDFLQRNRDVAERIIFSGDVDRTSVRHLAEAADCSVISSDFETFGLQMAEAVAVGTPVISTRCGGPEDILSDNRLGVLCDKGSVDALSEAMLYMLDNQASFQPAEIARIADGLLGENAIKEKWAAVYEGISPAGQDTE